VAFREVSVIEVREVLRAWLEGGFDSFAADPTSGSLTDTSSPPKATTRRFDSRPETPLPLAQRIELRRPKARDPRSSRGAGGNAVGA
jgi:hypothetical protein